MADAERASAGADLGGGEARFNAAAWNPRCLHQEGNIAFEDAAAGCVERTVVVAHPVLGLRLQASRKPWITAKVVQVRRVAGRERRGAACVPRQDC